MIDDLIGLVVTQLSSLTSIYKVKIERRTFASTGQDSLLVSHIEGIPGFVSFNGVHDHDVTLELAIAVQDPRSDTKAMDVMDAARQLLVGFEPFAGYGPIRYVSERLQIFESGLTAYLVRYEVSIPS